MSQEPTNSHRPDSRATVRTLVAGTILAVAIFAAGFVLRLLGQAAASDALSTAAVIVLLATPALGLVTTSVELRQAQKAAAAMALVVLLILGAATVIALLLAR